MYKSNLMIAGALICAQSAMANTYVQELQTIYTETPVASYYAYPDDQNFIPETVFMQQDDTFNFDTNIAITRDAEACAHPGVGFAERPMVICRNFNCTKLKSVSFGSTFTNWVRQYAFSNCTALTDVNLGNTATIELRAFQNCQALKSIYLPNCNSIH